MGISRDTRSLDIFLYVFSSSGAMKIKLTKWNGEIQVVEIKEEWLEDIMDAVEGQYYFCNKTLGIEFDGGNYREVMVID